LGIKAQHGTPTIFDHLQIDVTSANLQRPSSKRLAINLGVSALLLIGGVERLHADPDVTRVEAAPDHLSSLRSS
jgi:hypothetical protein